MLIFLTFIMSALWFLERMVSGTNYSKLPQFWMIQLEFDMKNQGCIKMFILTKKTNMYYTFDENLVEKCLEIPNFWQIYSFIQKRANGPRHFEYDSPSKPRKILMHMRSLQGFMNSLKSNPCSTTWAFLESLQFACFPADPCCSLHALCGKIHFLRLNLHLSEKFVCYCDVEIGKRFFVNLTC